MSKISESCYICSENSSVSGNDLLLHLKSPFIVAYLKSLQSSVKFSQSVYLKFKTQRPTTLL